MNQDSDPFLPPHHDLKKPKTRSNQYGSPKDEEQIIRGLERWKIGYYKGSAVQEQYK
jgi:hypothetical protein